MRVSILTKPLVLSFCSIILFTACSDFSSDEKEKKEKVIYKVPVETTQLLSQDITNTYRTTAVLEAKSESKVTNKVTGMIEQILVEEGMFVKKGQVLAEIDSESYQLDYERASIDLASAKAEYNRSKPINGKQIISAKDLEKLEFLVQSRTNQQAVAALKVRDSKVIAPITGVVAQRMVKAGNMTSNAESEMFHIVALETLQGVVYLPESEMNNVKVGQNAQLVFPANEQVNVPATVALISPIIDTESGTFKVTLMVDNDDSKLKPGMFAKVSLILDVHSNAQIVPQKALLVTDTETSIFVISDNKAKKVIVETGYEQNGLVEILTPLDTQESIVIVGQQGLKVDSPVKIIGEKSELAEQLDEDKSNESKDDTVNTANETESSE